MTDRDEIVHHMQSDASAMRAQERDGTELSMIGMFNSLLRSRGLIALLIVPVLVAVLVVTMARPRTYTSSAAFMPQSRRASGGLSSLAAQLGVGAALGGEGESPAFFADLVKTRELLRGVAQTRFKSGSSEGTLTELTAVDGATLAIREDAVIRRLQRDVTATVVQKSGVVRLSARASQPELAEQIIGRLLALVNEFNVKTRQSRASAERQFTSSRLAEVRVDLRNAEDELQRFLQRNREFRNSPHLVFQQERLTRNVAQQQQLFSTLSEAHEQAKIEEVRDTPVITIVERAEVPLQPDSRGLARNLLLALLASGIVAVLVAVARDASRGAFRSDRDEIAELSRLRRQALGDLRHPLSALQRRSRDDPAGADT